MQKIWSRSARALFLHPEFRKPWYKMDTKTKIVELVKELSEAATLAAQLHMNLAYIESLGDKIPDDLPIDKLNTDAMYIRNHIYTINYEVISNAPEF